MNLPGDILQRRAAAHPYPLLFATISGAHLYGFPSPDSDFDLRGTHILPLPKVDLVAHKLAGPEQSTLPDTDFTFHESERLRLETLLREAHEKSSLPESPLPPPPSTISSSASASPDGLVKIPAHPFTTLTPDSH